MSKTFDARKFDLEAKSGGKNTLLLDVANKGSVMVRIPKFRLCDVMDTTDTSPHPAFIVGGKEVDCIYVSKYLNVIEDGLAYSYGGRDPANLINIEQAREACYNKGKGWHLMTNAEWAAIALWSKKNGTMPHGNNYCGCDVNHKWEKAQKSPGYEWPYATNWNNMALYQRESDGYYMHIGRTLTGTGPATWSHDHTTDGAYDFNGCCWELMEGLQMRSGEIQIIPDNNAALGVDTSLNSSQWKAILQNGTLTTPGAGSTLHFNGEVIGNADKSDGRIGNLLLDTKRDKPAYTGGEVNDYYKYHNNPFESFKAADGVTVPQILKSLAIFPADTSGYEGDYIYARNYGDRIAIRGGYWPSAASAGVFALSFDVHRAWTDVHGGFRAAFVEL